MSKKKEITPEKAFKRLVYFAAFVLLVVIYVAITKPSNKENEPKENKITKVMDRQLDSIIRATMPEGTTISRKGEWEVLTEQRDDDSELRNDIYRFEKALTQNDIDTNKLALLEKKAIKARKILDGPRPKAYYRNVMLNVNDTLTKSCYQRTSEDLKESRFTIIANVRKDMNKQ